MSAYLPWHPADVYCDGVEYTSYQYGLHQDWISHSGLEGFPPAAYSNIVSRIVIIGYSSGPVDCQPENIIKESRIIKGKETLCFARIAPDFITERMCGYRVAGDRKK